jgi:hypothetical protein
LRIAEVIDEQQPRNIGIGGGLAISPTFKSYTHNRCYRVRDKVFRAHGVLWAVCRGLSEAGLRIAIAGPGKLLGNVCNINVIFRFYAAD